MAEPTVPALASRDMVSQSPPCLERKWKTPAFAELPCRSSADSVGFDVMHLYECVPAILAPHRAENVSLRHRWSCVGRERGERGPWQRRRASPARCEAIARGVDLPPPAAKVTYRRK